MGGFGSEDVTPTLRYRKATHLSQLVKLAVTLSLSLLLTAQMRAQSALDGFDPNANGYISVAVVQPDGKILVGGGFTTLSPNGGPPVTRNRIARLNPDGTLDAAFDPNANGDVGSIAVQADGKILVGGFFFGANSIGGQTRNAMARLDPITGQADSFDPNTNGYVYSIALQADGKILVGGFFSAIGGQVRSNIARLDPTTGLAEEFNPNANGIIHSIVVQADSKILVGGEFGGPNSIGQTGAIRNYIARLDPATGGVDSFNPNANNTVYSIALQADGKILLGGSFTRIGTRTRNFIARVDSTQGLTDSFNPNPSDFVFSLAVQADGKILVVGIFTSIGGQPRNQLARLDAISGLADSLDANATGGIGSVAVQADGKILVGGSFSSIAGQTRNNMARLETDGRLDQTLNLGIAGGGVISTAVQPDGKILIGGGFTTVLGVTRNNMARLNSDGTLDTAFDPDANNSIDSIAVQADGKILVGGNFNGPSSIGGQARNFIARLDSVTGLADSFDPNAINPFGLATVYSIAIQADGKILAAGAFSAIGGQTRNLLARLDATTGLADSFDPNPNSFVYSVALQADGKILAGGAFDQIGQQLRNRIARLDVTTGLADLFNPSANGFVYSIAVQTDGMILAGGAFNGVNSIGGQTRNRIARLDATTGLADSFDPDANDLVYSIAVQADGKIVTGGAFNGVNSIGGQTRNGIARLDATTGSADAFDPNANAQVQSIALQTDGKILASGLFQTIGGEMRNRFARLRNDTPALQNLAVTQGAITWTRSGSSPDLTRVTFESSTDNVTYALLGNGTATGSNWALTGLNLPTDQNLYVRARGYCRGGYQNGSESITESVRNAFLPGPTPTPTPTPAPTPTPTPSPTPTPTPGTFGNISTRLRVETGDNVLIGGFIVTGTQPKKVIVRAIGPSLPLIGALADPVLELRNSFGGLIASNDNWRSTQEAEIIATMIPPSNDLESAIVATLPANNAAYTEIVSGANNGTGVALVEAYDLDATVDSKLANISTRGLVQTGDDVLIGGLIVRGPNPLRVIVRAIGPSLPVPGALGDPTLELRDSSGTLLNFNNNWRSDQEAEIIATGIPPSNNLESAIVRDLAPGSYTAIVRGLNGTTGIALVEAYGLN